MYHDIVREFFRQLFTAPPEDKARPTLQKQNSFCTENYNILRKDQVYILSVLDVALCASHIGFLKPVILLNILGQKDEGTFDLYIATNPDEVASVSVHTAVKVTTADPEIHLVFPFRTPGPGWHSWMPLQASMKPPTFRPILTGARSGLPMNFWVCLRMGAS